MKRLTIAAALMAVGAAASAAEITFFEGEGFQGQRVVVTGTVPNFAQTGFNDRASSIIIRDGAWEVCDDAYFRGNCVALQPGRYPSLREAGMQNRISSARELNTYGGPPQAKGNRGARAVLYSGPEFRGQRFVIDTNVVPNLAGTGFNDRAQSLTVERGYWIFCSDAHFQGECRTFGPGDYPSLAGSLGQRISSGRRISNQYPYNDNANWGRRDATAAR
jgi:hypothetical protein